MHRQALLKQVLQVPVDLSATNADNSQKALLERKRKKKEEEKEAEEAKKSLLEKHNELVEAEIGNFWKLTRFFFLYVVNWK